MVSFIKMYLIFFQLQLIFKIDGSGVNPESFKGINTVFTLVLFQVVEISIFPVTCLFYILEVSFG